MKKEISINEPLFKKEAGPKAEYINKNSVSRFKKYLASDFFPVRAY